MTTNLPTMSRMMASYAQMCQSGICLSIEELLNYDNFKLSEFCNVFEPHPYEEALAKSARGFAEFYDIWLEHGKHYITCALYLFPTAPLYRIIPIVENCGVDFFLNDTIGREVFPQLSQADQRQAQKMINRMTKLDAALRLPREATNIERANHTVLQNIKGAAPDSWFREFLHLYNYHLKLAHRNCNTRTALSILSIEEYITERCHISGMPHTVALVEFSTNTFLDKDWLQEINISDQIKELQWQACLFGCLSNDLFSFEKECIDNQSDSNLVTIVALNKPEYSLQQAIEHAACLVSASLRNSMELLRMIQQELNTSPLDPIKVEQLKTYLQGIERGLQASWIWQLVTKRYKRPVSIWKETTEKTMVFA
jgi:hypothetical protein